MIALRMAVRNVFRHRTRSLVSLAAIAFGAFSLIFVSGYFGDTFLKMRESYINSHTGHLQIHRRGFLKDGGKQPYKFLLEDPAPVVERLRAIPGVAAVTPRLHFNGIASTGRVSASFIGQGVDVAIERMIPKDLDTGRRVGGGTFWGPSILSGVPLSKDRPDSVVLGRGLAAALGVKAGDPLTITAATVAGSINAWDVTVDGIFESSSQEFDNRFARLPLPLAQELIRTNAVETLMVLLTKTEDTDRVRAEVEAAIRETGWELEARSWPEMNDFYRQTKLLFEKMFRVLKTVIGIIVLLAIYNTVNMNVLERTGEIGTMRALGRRRRDVIANFLLEGAVLGAVGSALGVVFGSLATAAIGRIGIVMPPPAGATMFWISEPMVIPGALLFSFFFSLVIAILSSIIPARTAAQMGIAESLRHTT